MFLKSRNIYRQIRSLVLGLVLAFLTLVRYHRTVPPCFHHPFSRFNEWKIHQLESHLWTDLRNLYWIGSSDNPITKRQQLSINLRGLTPLTALGQIRGIPQVVCLVRELSQIILKTLMETSKFIMWSVAGHSLVQWRKVHQVREVQGVKLTRVTQTWSEIWKPWLSMLTVLLLSISGNTLKSSGKSRLNHETSSFRIS